ncbi:MAG TPA: group III truncated hemoglobin [Chitinophagaceae bacterium]|nr:group III truncated hemoglobin [Chitinophagaceae bacterium]
MKSDIRTRADIELLVKSFYEQVIKDPLIGHIFTTVFRVNFEKHLPVMFDFWENAIFFTGGYTGNPMKTHEALNKLYPLEKRHFERWVSLFVSTVDALFEGEKAELARQRAISISTVMQIKILNKENPLSHT